MLCRKYFFLSENLVNFLLIRLNPGLLSYHRIDKFSNVVKKSEIWRMLKVGLLLKSKCCLLNWLGEWAGRVVSIGGFSLIPVSFYTIKESSSKYGYSYFFSPDIFIFFIWPSTSLRVSWRLFLWGCFGT